MAPSYKGAGKNAESAMCLRGPGEFFQLFLLSKRRDTPSFMLPTFDEIVRRYCNFERKSSFFFFFFFFEFEKLLGNCFNYFETLTGLGKGNNDGRLKEGSKKIFLSNVI